MDLFDFIKSLGDWFNSGIYTWSEEFVAYLVSTAIMWWFQIQLEGIKFAWAISSLVLQNLNISQAIQMAWNTLPSDIAQAATFFRVPEALNLLISAAATRMVMSFIPGL